MAVRLPVLAVGILASALAFADTVDVTYTLGSKAGTVLPLLGVNAGPLHWGTKLDTKDVTLGFQQLGVTSVRTHDMPGALDMAVMYPDRTKDPSLQSSYNFTTGGTKSDYGSDDVARILQNNGLGMYLRIWDSAQDVVAPTASERANWALAAVEVVRHYQEGKWNGFSNLVTHVEIGNEPDSEFFWPSTYTKEEFYALYSDTAKAIRAAFPTLKIGGPGVTQSGYKSSAGQQWTRGFLDYVRSAGAPLDFLSWHTYTNTPDDYATGAAFYRSELDSRGFTSTEEHVTEWHSFVTPTNDPTADAANVQTRTMGKAAAIVTTTWITLQQNGISQAFMYRANDPSPADHSRYGIFSTDALPRKTALAFSLWSEFAGYADRIDPAASASVSGLKALAAQRSDGQIAILVANTGTATKTWTVGFSDARRLSDYPLSLKTVDDDHALVDVSVPNGTSFDIAANTVQLLTLHARSGSFSASATSFGTTSAMLLGANLQVAGAHIGQSGAVFLAATFGNQWWFHNGTGWVYFTGGEYPAYFTGPMPALLSVPVFGAATDTLSLAGYRVYMGYGASAAEMLSATRYQLIYTFTGN